MEGLDYVESVILPTEYERLEIPVEIDTRGQCLLG
jgi:hypothetical protein